MQHNRSNLESAIDAVRSKRARATTRQVADGQSWYPSVGILTAELAERYSVPQDSIIRAIAATSPRRPWHTVGRRVGNVDVVMRMLEALSSGVQPAYTGLHAREDVAWAILRGTGTLSGRKVESFAANISGRDGYVVTADVHAGRGAGYADGPKNDAEYDTIEEAYRIVAAEYNERPCDTQAIVWLVQTGYGAAL